MKRSTIYYPCQAVQKTNRLLFKCVTRCPESNGHSLLTAQVFLCSERNILTLIKCPKSDFAWECVKVPSGSHTFTLYTLHCQRFQMKSLSFSAKGHAASVGLKLRLHASVTLIHTLIRSLSELPYSLQAFSKKNFSSCPLIDKNLIIKATICAAYIYKCVCVQRPVRLAISPSPPGPSCFVWACLAAALLSAECAKFIMWSPCLVYMLLSVASSICHD